MDLTNEQGIVTDNLRAWAHNDLETSKNEQTFLRSGIQNTDNKCHVFQTITKTI